MNREIRWPTVALVAAVVAGVVAIFAFAGPAERVEYLSILSVLGTSLAAVMRAAFGAAKATPTRISSHSYDFRRCSECGLEIAVDGHAEGCSKGDDDPGEGGEVLAEEPPTKPLPHLGHPRSLVRSIQRHAIALACLVRSIQRHAIALACLVLSACSPSALQTHATIALVASHTLEVTRASALSTCTALRDTCAADAACVESTRADCLAVADAQDVAVAAVSSYVDAVEIAALADEGRVMEALRFALEAAASAWAELGARLAAVGIALPSIGGVQ